MRVVYSAVAIVAVLGFVSLIPGVKDAAIYYYWRIANGSTMEIANECYLVPNGWSIHSQEEYMESDLVVVQSNIDDQYVFASIGDGRIVTTESASSGSSERNLEKKGVFELENLSGENHARYWTYARNGKLVVLGKSKEVVLKLSEEIQLCQT